MLPSRKLAAILAADVVNYSGQIKADEARTLGALRSLRTELFEPTVENGGGTVIKRMGDGWLVEFSAVSDAVRSAIGVQASLREHSQLEMRIGVHLGDVVRDGDDIYGDGVNLAARLEQGAPRGGVLISDIVYRSLDGRMAGSFRDAGSRQFKNAPVAMHVFEWTPPGTAPVTATADTATRHDPLTIAVLPFDNLSSDPEQEFFADGITEEIITTLSKLPALKVVARNSTFAYRGQSVDFQQVRAELNVGLVLEGSVRFGGNRARITAQLIDTGSGTHLWADRFDRSLEDVFGVQDEIALRVATELQVELLEGEMARFHGAGTHDLEAWTEQMQAVACTRKMTREACIQGHRHAERAITLDPDYAAPYATLAFVQSVEARHGYTDSKTDTIARARANARRSLELEPYNPDAWAVLGFVDAIEGNLDAAMLSMRTALDQNPNHADVWARLSITYTFNGQTEDAVRAAQEAIRLNPQYPGWYAGNLGFAHRMAGDLAAAEARFREYSQREAGFGHLDLALVHMTAGRLEEARQEASEHLRYRPGFRISVWAQTQLFADPALLEQDCAALRLAGLPE